MLSCRWAVGAVAATADHWRQNTFGLFLDGRVKLCSPHVCWCASLEIDRKSEPVIIHLGAFLLATKRARECARPPASQPACWCRPATLGGGGANGINQMEVLVVHCAPRTSIGAPVGRVCVMFASSCGHTCFQANVSSMKQLKCSFGRSFFRSLAGWRVL